MRRLFLVSYDIADPKRLQVVFKIMRGYGDRLQDSVYRCEISEKEKLELMGHLGAVIHHEQDQVLFVPLGPPGGEIEEAFETLGKPYLRLDRHAVVI